MVGTGRIQLSGTSFAAPVVAGTAASILARHPDWTPDQVKGALMRTARADRNGNRRAARRRRDHGLARGRPRRSRRTQQGLEKFVTQVRGAQPVFDAMSWASAAKASMSWNSMSWTDQSWSDQSWSDQAWQAMSWTDMSWSSMSWTDMSLDGHELDGHVAGDAAGRRRHDEQRRRHRRRRPISAAATDPDTAVPVDGVSPRRGARRHGPRAAGAPALSGRGERGHGEGPLRRALVVSYPSGDRQNRGRPERGMTFPAAAVTVSPVRTAARAAARKERATRDDCHPERRGLEGEQSESRAAAAQAATVGGRVRDRHRHLRARRRLPLLGRLGAVPADKWTTFGILATGAAVTHTYTVRTSRDTAFHTSWVFLIPSALLLPPELVALIGDRHARAGVAEGALRLVHPELQHLQLHARQPRHLGRRDAGARRRPARPERQPPLGARGPDGVHGRRRGQPHRPRADDDARARTVAPRGRRLLVREPHDRLRALDARTRGRGVLGAEPVADPVRDRAAARSSTARSRSRSCRRRRASTRRPASSTHGTSRRSCRRSSCARSASSGPCR